MVEAPLTAAEAPVISVVGRDFLAAATRRRMITAIVANKITPTQEPAII